MEKHYFLENTNYLKFTANSYSISSITISKKKRYKTRSLISFLSLLMMFFFSSNSISAQVTITKPNLSIPVCSGFPSSYYSLGDIEIYEYYVNDFSIGNSKTLILSAPSNFEFQPSVGTLYYNSLGNVTPTAINISATTITITYNCDNINKGDNFTINGLRIRAINASSSGNITRTGGTGTISGLTNGTTLTNTLTSVTGTPPTTANAGTNQNLATCATTTTLSANAPTYGTGTWSVVSGSATITTPSSPTSGVTGLAIGTTATLRWTITNGICGSSTSDVTITTSMGTACLVYCTSSGGTFPNGIKGVVFNTINNTNTAVNVAYSNYTAINTTVTKGSSYNLSIYLDTGGNFKDYQSVWIDWNANGLFTDPGEFYNLGSVQNVTNGLSSFSPYSISVPAGATTAAVRMRVQSKFSGATTGSCDSGFDGEVEDYTINIIDPPPCTTPTAQPTALFLNSTLNSVSGSFTIPGAATNNFLVVVNTSGVEPVPVDGTTYTIGSTALGSSNIVVDTDGNNTFTASSLASSTLYYIYVFPFNSLCSGGPLYKTTSPLNGSTTTLAPNYCTPSVNSGSQSSSYINQVNFIGNITNSDNPSTYSSSPLGYQNFTASGTRATQAQGEGVNVFTNTTGGANYMKAWVDWNSNGIFDESTEVVYQCTNAFINTTFGFKIPETTIPGNYRIRIRINRSNSSTDNTFGACGNIANYGETEDYLFTVVANCATKITSIINGTNCGEGSVTLGATASAGTTSFRWYTSQTGGTYVSTASNTWATPSISTTTTYYVTAYNGSCESLFRTPILATIKPLPSLTFANANPEVCGENSIIDLQASANNEQVYLIDENFENGLGSFTNISINSPNAAKTNWQTQTSTYVPAYPTFPVWYPAISSGFGTNKFAMTTSDIAVTSAANIFGEVETALESAAVNTTNYINLTLSFKIYFSSYYDSDSATSEYVIVEYKNGAGAWTAVPGQQYLSDIGIGTQFATKSFDMSAYKNIAALQIRIRYKSSWADGVAVDDIKLFGDKPLSASFQWTSNSPIDAYTDAACTLPYTTGAPVSIVYVKPTLTQLEQTNYSFKATANLANGCFTTATINVTNKSNIWKGTTDNDWNKASNWLPAAVPTANTCVIIPTGTTSKISNTPDAFAKTVTIKAPTGNLELQSGKNLTVTDNIIVETGATFNVRNSASLIQVNNIANTGIVNVERTSSLIKKLDYTYWSSPVSGFTLGGFSSSNSYMYSWIPTVSNAGGNWAQENDSAIMSPGTGYILRTPWGHIDGTAYTATFIGTPNNGDILTPISKGTLVGVTDVNAEDDEWNLIGNPYPSALDASAFLNLPANVTTIDGTIYVWTHNSQPDAAAIDPFYGDYGFNYTENDYASFNRTGAVSTRSSAVTGGNAPTGYIASGQSFFVKAANAMTNGTTKNATFNNSMRVGVEGKNNDFFKLTKNNKNESIPRSVPALEKHRIWINLTNNSGAFSQTLVGYIQDATQGLDRGFDGESLGGNDVGFYSIIPEAQLTIQGRALPFDENDQVTLGYYSEISGELSIRIDHIDGLFETQDIYLEDKELDVIQNLKEKPYVFNTEIGDFDDRFVLRYSTTDQSLAVDTFKISDTVLVIVNQKVTVKSSNEQIKNIDVFDLAGRRIDSYKKVNATQFTLNHLNKDTVGLILKITMENDTVLSKKIIY